MSKFVPTGPEFVHEALVVIGGALLAAIVLSKIPALKNFIRAQAGLTDSDACNCQK